MSTLAICIPSYNRLEGVSRLLKSLQQIPKSVARHLEIIISDNHSQPPVYEAICKWKSKNNHLNILLKRHSRNIGASANIVSLLKMTTAEWAVIVGDDDTILETNIKNIVMKLRSEKKQASILLGKENNANNINGLPLKIFFLKHGLTKFGFIGNHIFHTYETKKILNQTTIKKILGWPHMYILLTSALKHGLTFYNIQLVKKKATCDEYTWTSKDWLILISLRQKILQNIKCKNIILYYFLSLRNFFSHQMQYNIYKTSLLKRLNKNNINSQNCDINSMFKILNNNFFFKFLLIELKILNCIPISLFKFIYFLTKKTKWKCYESKLTSNNKKISYFTRKI